MRSVESGETSSGPLGTGLVMEALLETVGLVLTLRSLRCFGGMSTVLVLG